MSVQVLPVAQAAKIHAFAELESKKKVTSAELIATMKNYVDGGWAISSRVVISLIDRVILTNTEKHLLAGYAENGAADQMERGHSKDAHEHKMVLARLSR
ncbi:MAG: hypothetical protein WCF94_03945 [bacterium]